MERRRVLRLVTSEAQRGRRLDDVLGNWLAGELQHPVSKSAVRRLVMAGAVRTSDGPLRRPGYLLRPGTRLTVLVRPGRLQLPAAPAPLAVTQVLYEDDVLIAVDKPPGIPTHATVDPRRPHLVGLVQQFLAARAAARGAPASEPHYLAVHQRLDRDTTGVVLFAKAAAANASLARAFARGGASKTYHALTVRPRREPPKLWQVTSELAPSGASRGPRIASAPGAGRVAHTQLATLRRFPQGLLVEARPLTGRKHQIRVHLAEAGLPILGDTGYGGPSQLAGLTLPRPMLHARRLALAHPLTGAELVIESAYPPDFRRVLEKLAGGFTPGASFA